MTWKIELRKLELAKQWDAAIEFMQKTIDANPNDMEAYIFINFLLMNLLVEEDFDETKHDYYEYLIKTYFDESYAKFSNNPEYLFFTAWTAVMADWYFGIDVKDYIAMFNQAAILDPNNLLYKDRYYSSLDLQIPKNRELVRAYAELVLNEDSPIQLALKQKGALGEMLLKINNNYWNKKIEDINRTYKTAK